MVAGIESFIHKFSDYSDCYSIIGGAACDILMTEADTEFRATHLSSSNYRMEWMRLWNRGGGADKNLD